MWQPNSLPLSDFKRAGILSFFFFLMFSCSPVVTLRSTKNWVHIPLKEISDANKLFCARCSGYRVAPKTKLCVTLLTSTKFVFLLPGRHGALQGCLSRFYAGVWTGAARKTRGHRGGPEKLQDWAWVRSLWTIQLESQSAAFFLLGYNKHALSVVLGFFFLDRSNLAYIQICEMNTGRITWLLCCDYLCTTGRLAVLIWTGYSLLF